MYISIKINVGMQNKLVNCLTINNNKNKNTLGGRDGIIMCLDNVIIMFTYSKHNENISKATPGTNKLLSRFVVNNLF